MKKKERTPEEKVRRGKFALGFVLFMFIATVFMRLGTGKVESPISRLDHLLDSIVTADFPEGTEIISKNSVETSHIKTAEMDSLNAARLRYNRTMNKYKIEKTIDTTVTGQLRREVRKYERAVQRQRKAGLEQFIIRSVKLRRPDGQVIFAYQKTDLGKTRSELFEVTPISSEYDADSLARYGAYDIEDEYDFSTEEEDEDEGSLMDYIREGLLDSE